MRICTAVLAAQYRPSPGEESTAMCWQNYSKVALWSLGHKPGLWRCRAKACLWSRGNFQFAEKPLFSAAEPGNRMFGAIYERS